MATLEELRAQLDGIDNEIIELYKKRMDVCMEIGDIKISAGNKVFDKQREREKLAAVAAKVTEEFHKKTAACKATVTGILLDKGGTCGKSLEPFCDKIYHSSDLTEDEIALDILNSKVS